ncbi:MAG: TadE/TadG family type IV pilus assembly protein [Pseudomonadota bacterium]
MLRSLTHTLRSSSALAGAARCFRRDRRGNIGLTASLLAGPLFAMMGGAVDLVHYATVRSEIQGALDTGVLASASLTNQGDPLTVIQNYLDANLDPGLIDKSLLTIDVTAVQSLNKVEVIVTANYSVDTIFMGLFGVNNLPVSVSVGGEQSVQDVEISMVLDISSSMNGSKLTNLISAAQDFVDTVLEDDVIDYTSINLIPFGGTVRLPSEFDGFLDPAEPVEYEGCLELDHFDADTFAFGGDDYHYLYVDGDTDEDANRGNNEKSGSGAADSYHQAVPAFWKWNSGNPWCPKDTTIAKFLTNDKGALQSAIGGFELSDGTGMDIGAMIGLLALDPAWNGKLGGTFPERPTAWNGEVLKVLLIMTDGEITRQFRPKILLPDSSNDDLTRTNENRDELDGGKNERTRITTSEARDHFYDVCQVARDNNVLVFTIGFQINTSKWSHTALGDCPQYPSQYYFVENLDIETAFKSIAATINNLRLTM